MLKTRLLKKLLPILVILQIIVPIAAKAQNQTLPLQKAMLDQDYYDEEEFESYESISNTPQIYDPLEKYNRKIYAFNDAFDRYFFEHVAKLYRRGFPRPIRKSIRNFLVNISLPISAINSFAQGKTDNGLATLSNFIINSTIGIFGIFDVAGEKNIHYNKEDFGQTLGHYGTGSGAYLMIPILGPSSTRDFSGWAIDKSVDPLGFNLAEIGNDRDLVDNQYRIGLTIASGIDSRENLIDIIDSVRHDSFDPYATIRSAYLQKRKNEVKK